jgi:hypothetical protein
MAQSSPIECIFALSQADHNDDYALDRNEFQAVLLEMAAAAHNNSHDVGGASGCQIPTIDSSALVQSLYDEAACSCQNYNTLTTYTQQPVAPPPPACLCRQAGATISVPQMYPATYSLSICQAISDLLQTSCTDTTTMSSTSETAQPQTTADSGAKVPMSVIFVLVLVFGTIVGAIGMAVYLWHRRRRHTGQPPGHKRSMDGSGQCHNHNNSVDDNLHWAATTVLWRDSTDPTALDDSESDCRTESMEEGSVSPATTTSSPIADDNVAVQRPTR